LRKKEHYLRHGQKAFSLLDGASEVQPSWEFINSSDKSRRDGLNKTA
jgi:hypothetical protein